MSTDDLVNDPFSVVDGSADDLLQSVRICLIGVNVEALQQQLQPLSHQVNVVVKFR